MSPIHKSAGFVGLLSATMAGFAIAGITLAVPGLVQAIFGPPPPFEDLVQTVKLRLWGVGIALACSLVGGSIAAALTGSGNWRRGLRLGFAVATGFIIPTLVPVRTIRSAIWAAEDISINAPYVRFAVAAVAGFGLAATLAGVAEYGMRVRSGEKPGMITTKLKITVVLAGVVLALAPAGVGLALLQVEATKAQERSGQLLRSLSLDVMVPSYVPAGLELGNKTAIVTPPGQHPESQVWLTYTGEGKRLRLIQTAATDSGGKPDACTDPVPVPCEVEESGIAPNLYEVRSETTESPGGGRAIAVVGETEIDITYSRLDLQQIARVVDSFEPKDPTEIEGLTASSSYP